MTDFDVDVLHFNPTTDEAIIACAVAEQSKRIRFFIRLHIETGRAYMCRAFSYAGQHATTDKYNWQATWPHRIAYEASVDVNTVLSAPFSLLNDAGDSRIPHAHNFRNPHMEARYELTNSGIYTGDSMEQLVAPNGSVVLQRLAPGEILEADGDDLEME